MADSQRKQFQKSNLNNEKFTKNPVNLRISTNNPVQKRARSYQDLNHKTNDYSHVESKVKKYIKDLQEEDKTRSITRTKSMPETSNKSPFNNIESSTKDINLLKQQLLELKNRAAYTEELNDELTKKNQKKLLEKNGIKQTIENVRYQLEDAKEKNSRNPIEMIRKVCTPRKNQTETGSYPTTTNFLSQSFNLTDNSMLDSIEEHPVLKRQLKYFRLNEHFDVDSDESDSSDKILFKKTVQSKSKKFKKKLIKVIFGKCVTETSLDENQISSVDSKRFPADSAYNSNY